MNSFARTLLTIPLLLLTFKAGACEDWPWFLGLRHDGTSMDSNVDLSWGVDGPKVLWKQPMGTGYSAPSIAGNLVVVHHRLKNQEIVSCRSAQDGNEVWSHSYESSYSDPYGYNNGPRCSPVLVGDECYTLGAEGRLSCLALADGKLKWEKELGQNFDLPDWFFGVGCSPIVDGDRLIVLVGGQPDSGVVCFDRHNGKVLWKTVGSKTWTGVTDVHSGQPYEWKGDEMVVSYSSPIVATLHGRRHLLCLVRQGLVSLNPETGSHNFVYWFRPKVHESVNAARPVVIGNRIFLSAAYRLGSAMLEVSEDGRSVSEVWKDPRSMLAHWSTPIHVDGYIYGFSGRHENEGELRCIRASDGRLMWSETGFQGDLRQFVRNRATGELVDRETGKNVPYPYFGRGALTRVGDRFVALGERGTLAVVRIDPQKYVEERRFSFPEIHYPAWTAPVISNGAMYLRSEDWLLSLQPGEK